MTRTATEPATSDDGRGRARQGEVFRAGVRGRRPPVPTGPALEEAARRRMSRRAEAYVVGGAGAEATVKANREAFDRHHLVPRVLTGHTRRDLTVRLLGRSLPTPVLLAPLGALDLVRRGADLAVARAAARAGVPYVVSTQGCAPMEEVAARMGDVPWWFQLYWSTDEALVDSLLGRAEAAGASAVVVTLDTTMLGWRPRDLDLGSLPFARSVGIAQYTSDPRFRELVAARLAARDAAPGGVTTATPRERPTVAALGALLSIARTHPGPVLDNLRSAEPRAAVETFLDIYSNPGLSWDHLATLRSRTGLPVVLKGVLHPADARRALDLGVDAVVVSNHGGRQVDRSVASLDALRAIRAEVGREPTLLLDSGVRSGADVLVALALGADAVCLGRPNAYGLALAGERGVHEVVSNVLAELDLTMALAGVRSVSDLGPDLLVST